MLRSAIRAVLRYWRVGVQGFGSWPAACIGWTIRMGSVSRPFVGACPLHDLRRPKSPTRPASDFVV
eukprot:15330894-Alexandrium_andersonii.AAC.1